MPARTPDEAPSGALAQTEASPVSSVNAAMARSPLNQERLELTEEIGVAEQ